MGKLARKIMLKTSRIFPADLISAATNTRRQELSVAYNCNDVFGNQEILVYILVDICDILGQFKGTIRVCGDKTIT